MILPRASVGGDNDVFDLLNDRFHRVRLRDLLFLHLGLYLFELSAQMQLLVAVVLHKLRQRQLGL